MNAERVEEVIAALDRGELRVAEPDGDDWRVNTEAQEAILEYFRLRQMEPQEVGPFEYHDKIPLKHDYAKLGVRVVPPAVARYGAFLSPGVVMMPSYVNIGAWVGPRTMVDTWATVGSGAQIGADVHLAGGVGIGGVLEPPGARPVIVEDGAFIGSRAHPDGRRSRRRGCSARPERVVDVVGPDHRRDRRRTGRASWLRPAARDRRTRNAAEGLSCRHVSPRVRADRRLAQRIDRPEGQLERRPTRARPLVDLDSADLLRRSRQTGSAVVVQLDEEVSARKVDVNGALAPAVRNCGGGGRDRARSR